MKSGRVTAEQYLEYLLIAENVERRGQAETDPMKKARIAAFLKEYWGIRQGSRNDLWNNSRSLNDIADVIGESVDNTHKIMRLNKLISPLQELVSKGKLRTTAAEQLAYLTEDEQRALFDALGESVAKTTVSEAGEIKQEARRAAYWKAKQRFRQNGGSGQDTAVQGYVTSTSQGCDANVTHTHTKSVCMYTSAILPDVA